MVVKRANKFQKMRLIVHGSQRVGKKLRHRHYKSADSQILLSQNRSGQYSIYGLRATNPQLKVFQRNAISKNAIFLVPESLSSSPVISFSQPKSSKASQLTGPIKFVLTLLDCWNLERKDAINILGFEEAESDHVFDLLDGKGLLHGRDAKDRLSYLVSIRESLNGFFRDLKTENDWLRERQPLLDGKVPMTLLLDGSMENILLVKEYVDFMVGR